MIQSTTIAWSDDVRLQAGDPLVHVYLFGPIRLVVRDGAYSMEWALYSERHCYTEDGQWTTRFKNTGPEFSPPIVYGHSSWEGDAQWRTNRDSPAHIMLVKEAHGIGQAMTALCAIAYNHVSHSAALDYPPARELMPEGVEVPIPDDGYLGWDACPECTGLSKEAYRVEMIDDGLQDWAVLECSNKHQWRIDYSDDR